MLTLIGCINYGLSLGYGLTFLLGGVWIVSAAQVSRAARSLHLTVQPPAQAVAGQPVTFIAAVTQGGPAGNVLIRAVAVQNGVGRPVSTSGPVSHSGPVAGAATLALTVPAPVRGSLKLAGVRLIAVDLLGFWHASYRVPDCADMLVAPAPAADAPPPPQQSAEGAGETGQRLPGHDEFAGVRPYIAGDAPRLIS